MKRKEIVIKGETYVFKFCEENIYQIDVFTPETEKIGDKIGIVNFSLKCNGYSNNLWINIIDVKDEYQFKGIGQALLDAVETFAKMRRVYAIEGRFYPRNQYARNFYEKNGFEIYKDGYETYLFKSMNYKTKELKNEQQSECLGLFN